VCPLAFSDRRPENICHPAIIVAEPELPDMRPETLAATLWKNDDNAVLGLR
jgi:hypothetical protein